MKPVETPSTRERAQAARLLHAYGARGAQRRTGIHPTALRNVAAGASVSPQTLVTLRDAIKTDDDFKVSKSAVAGVQKKPSVAWPLAAVRAARDAQLAGDFSKSQPLAVGMRGDDAIFVAFFNRIAPLSSLPVNMVAAKAGKSVADAAEAGISYKKKTLVSIAGTMVNHGVAFGYNDQVTSEDGSTVRFEHREWPIEFVKWDEKKRLYVTKVEGAPDQDIIHGDGHWTVYAKTENLPHQQEACIIPGALIFFAHLDSIRSWAASADSHGQAKIIGNLPEGVSMQEGDQDTASPEGASMLATLNDLVSGSSGAGLIPYGAEAKFIANGSSAWQVFSELAMNREKAAARVWLGTDGVLGAQGGAPGVDVSALFGVALTKVQGDCETIEECFYSGVLVPWTAINYGDSTKAPHIKFAIPDADADQKRAQVVADTVAFFDELKLWKENGFEVNQNIVDQLANKYNVEPPTLAETGESVPSITLATTDIAKIVLVREARLAQGLPPFKDYRDELTLTELDEKIKADAAARAAGVTNGTQPDPNASPEVGPDAVQDPPGANQPPEGEAVPGATQA